MVSQVKRALIYVNEANCPIGSFESKYAHGVTFQLPQLFANYDTEPVTLM